MEVDIDPSGSPIGVGRMAEVFTIDDERVVKLLRPEWPAHYLDTEEHKARAVHAVGICSPAVLGRVVVDGRPGIVFERVSARSMLDAAIADLGGAFDLAERLGDLHADLLGTSTPGLPDVKELLARNIDASNLPVRERNAARDVLPTLPDGRATLHFDLHPGNVMVGEDGLSVIDWSNASTGDPAADLARTRLLMTPLSAGAVVDLDDEITRFVIEFANRYAARCLGRISVPEGEIEAWRLPVTAARLQEVVGDERDALRAEVTRLVDSR